MTDTVLVDYKSFSCIICGDPDYSCFGTDSTTFIDSTSTGMRLTKLVFKFLHTPCTSSPTTLFLNGDTMGTFNNTYSCSCNSCTMDSVVITGAKLSSYLQGDTNKFIYKGGSSLCIARYMIIRTWTPAVDYDMATTSLTGPLLACPGSRTIEVLLTNWGLKQVDSVEVHWTYNGVTQTTVKTTGTIDTLGGSGSNTKNVSLGSKTLVKGKMDTLVAWTEKPNGMSDTVNHNDTLRSIVAPAFKDTLTVGGSSPDFTKIQDALDALMQFGVCGPVVVSIRPGTYSEQLMLGPIPGTDTTNTVTIQSSTGDSTAVNITHGASSSSNFTLQVLNCAFVRFAQLTFTATGSSYSRVVDLAMGGNNDLKFIGCRLHGVSTTSTSDTRALVYGRSTSLTNHQIAFANCIFDKGSTGVYLSNPFALPGHGTSITGCTFTSQYYRNIWLRYLHGCFVANNSLTRGSSSASWGTNLATSDNSGEFEISNNLITALNGGTGIDVSWKTGDTNNLTRIINNFVSITASHSGSCVPMYLYYANFVRLLHNSFFAETGYTSNHCVYSYYGSNLHFSGNSIFNKNPGKAWHCEFPSGTPNVTHSNHNNIYSFGSTLAFWNASAANLAALQALSGQDSTSQSADPGYKSKTDLHASAVELNGTADPSTGVMDDYDGQPRDSLRPDIGADEFDLPPNDAALLDIKKFKADSTCVNVILRNMGNDTLKSVTIAWTFNGVSQTPLAWTGSLVSGDTAHVCVGTKVFKADSAYHLKLWTTSPNGLTDTVNHNDTIEKTVYPALCGVYTIGGTAPDYPTFSAAVDALKKGGVLDSALFKVRDGTYTEQLRINEIECVENKDQVIFESESGDSTKVTLTYGSSSWSNNYTIWLDSADGITFRLMTISNTSSTYARVIYISGGADYNKFNNNIIENNDSTGSTTSRVLIYNESSPDHYFCLVNNVMRRGTYGYYGRGSFSNMDKMPLIQGNTFVKQGYVGIDALYCEDLRILSNNLSSESSNYWAGLDIDEMSGQARIEKNIITGPTLMERYGMYLNDFDYGDTSWILNNFVSRGGTRTNGYGIHAEDFTRGMFFNNSINVRQTDTTTSGAMYFEGGTYDVCNNIFRCETGGYAMYRNWGTVNSDYNNIQTPGTRFTYWGGATYVNLGAHVTGTSQDSNSISIDPQFNSSTDLHVTSPAMDKTGKSVAFVTDDIDGDARDSVPDIGADEFEPAKHDIGVTSFISPAPTFPADTLPIIVSIFNFGTDTVFSGTVKTKFNSDTLADKSFADTLVSGDSIHLTIGTYPFRSDTTYNFMAWTVKPNGVTDQKMSNDTFKVENKLAAMRGIYTIGGTSPDFANFTAAIAALKLRGIVDSVKFKVRNGTYSEQLHITSISGASDKNSIIFEGENKDSSLVILTHASTHWDTNYTVYVDGADGVSFRHLTIAATNATYGRVVFFRNGSDRLCIENCHLKGVNVSYHSNYHYIVYSTSTSDHGFVCRNNYITDGSAGIFIEANSTYSQRETGTSISGNTFENFYYYGMYLTYQKGVKILRNVLTTNTNTSSGHGIHLWYNTDSFCVIRNTVHFDKSGHGIYGYFCGYTDSDSNLVVNNAVTCGVLTNYRYGIRFYYPRGIRIAHNSINLVGTGAPNSYCIGVDGGGGGNHILNNICENQAGGYTHYFPSSGAIASCNYNNLRTNGSHFGYFNTGAVGTFAAWKSTSSFDANSTQHNPGFASNSDIHISNVDLDATVSRLPYALDDIDGESRDTTADMGADEIRLKGLDAGIQQILTPKTPFLADTQYVKVVLKNYGSTPLTSVDIHWVLNGDTGTVYKWADTLQSKDTAWVCIERKFFDIDSTYSLKVWTAKPNNGTDSLATNDTAETVDQYPGLSGTYTIGGASPDFVDFTAAVTALKRGGIVDSVIFNVRNGTYSEQITIPYIVGANGKNKIIFQSIGSGNAANVILTYTSTSWTNNWVVKLDSARGITFRRITITNGGTSTYSNCARFINNADYNEFRECIFKGNTGSNSTTTHRALIYTEISNNHNNDFNCIIGNTFTNGSYGIYQYGYNNGIYDKNWLIKSNSFSDHYYMAIHLYYADTTTITCNTISHAGTYKTSSNYGIYCVTQRGGHTITHNATKGTFYRGCHLSDCDGLNTRYSLVANNMFQTDQSGGSAFYSDGSSYQNIYFNSFHTSNSGGTNRALQTWYNSNNRLVNNIAVEKGNGHAWYHGGGTSVFTRINYNNYYGNGTNLAYYGFSNRANFAALKSATGKDTNSLNVDPSFVADDDLHAREITLNEAGDLLAEVSDDYDKTARDTAKPDIGADEFDPPAPEDAGIVNYHGPVAPFKAGSKNVEVVLKNFGSDTLVSATINWTVNGVSQTAHSWTGSLLPGKSDTVNIGSYTFPKVTAHNMVFWSTIPNGVTDTLNYNDTARADSVYAALDTCYTIGASGADFPSFTAAVDALQKAGILDTVTFKVQTGTYNEQFTIGPYAGASASRPVTFKSQSGDSTDVTVTHKNTFAANYIVRLNGADYIKFQGMTFKPTDNNYGHGIVLSGGSNGIQICNNQFLGLTNPWYYSSTFILSSTDNDDSCTIENNFFNQGNQAIIFYGLGYSNPESGLIIRNNTIQNGARTAMYLANHQGMKVIGNRIKLKNNSSGKVGIQVVNSRFDLDVSCNNITSDGIYDYGIYVDHDGTVSQQGMVYNNFVAIKNNAGGRYGIYSYYSTYVNFYFNSVNIYGGTNTGTYALRVHYGSNIQSKNNILCNRNGGYAIYTFGSGLTNSDYNNMYTTGTNLGYSGGNRTDLSAWKTATSQDANSMSVDPLFTSNDNLHVYISSLDSAGTSISGITKDIDKDTRNTTHPDIGADEFNSLLHNIGISTITKPIDGCDLDSQIIGVVIFNYGSQPQTNYSVCYSVDGGTAVKDTITDTIGPGKSKSYDFLVKHKFTTHKTYTVTAWTKLASDQDASNDTASASVINYSTPAAVSSMFPLDTTKDLDYPITFSWAPASGASKYDLYIWDDTASSRPGSPVKLDLSQISTQIFSGLTYGRTYKWQVVAKNSACGTDGPIQKFTMRFLPDLIVESVSSPTTAFSGNTISVSWQIKNIGGGPTGTGTWYDLVYLSTDSVYDSGDQYMGGIRNPSALNASSNYSNNMSINLPNGITGTYYIIVRTDAYGYVLEANEGNNIGTDTSGMSVSLTPPPDLIVTAITRPSIAGSGTNINITYTVKNDGTGGTRTTLWYDYIYWSADTTFGAGATFLKSVRRTGALDPDSTYFNTESITVPNFISGAHYVYVFTDASDRVYEHTSNSNNVTRSDSISVILSPPPDLVVSDVVLPDSASTCDVVAVNFNTINQGGGGTLRGFSDAVYYSTSNVYSSSTATRLRTKYNPTLPGGDTAKNSLSFTIPNNLNGKYYFFVLTDIFNQVNEHVHEGNNTSAVDSMIILSPDLTVFNLRTSKTDTTGDTTLLCYEIINAGQGSAPSKSRTDRFYMSKKSTFDIDSATKLSDVSYSVAIPAGDTVSRKAIVKIPDGFDGDWYFYVHTDFVNTIFENGADNNNQGRSDTVRITLAPYPDLVPSLITVPDTANAGDTATIKFSVTNNGDTTAKSNWADRIYISKDTVLDRGSDRQLANILHSNDLEEDSVYTVSTLITYPSNLPAGDYYYFLEVDADDNVYEHSGDTNNVDRSEKQYVDGYPPVDLKVLDLSSSDTFNSGKNTTVTWTVKNIGQAATTGGFWDDCIFISTDSILSTNDTRIHTEQINLTVSKDSSYTSIVTFTVPNGLSGDYYLFVRADKKDANNDSDTSNNTGGKRSSGALTKIHINLTPPPDLQTSLLSVPSTGTAGQSIKVVWKTTNKGTGPTVNGHWADNIYLSTDYTLDNSDFRISNYVRSSNLDKDSCYTDSVDAFIPAHFIGNYILILKTDAENREFENDKENNNTASIIITVSKAPPADLIVDEVTTTDSLVSGQTAKVIWKIKNTGTNPASGYMRDNVYLSADSVVDATDVLLGSKSYSVNLTPSSTRSDSITGTFTGVPLGDYYVLVQTDVLNNISESNDTNNTGKSEQLNIDIPQIFLNVKKNDTLFDNKERLYRLIISDSLIGESLLVNLEGDSSHGNNEMYLRKGAVPTRSEFDYGYSDPFAGNQEVIVPVLDSGTYYIMVYGENTSGSFQKICVLAKILEFEIRKITPSTGGNTGQVTLRIEGSKFGDSTRFILSDGEHKIRSIVADSTEDAANVEGIKQDADTFLVVNPTLAYITFDLSGEPKGTYDISGINPGDSLDEDTTTLSKAFSVVQGLPPDIQLNVTRPANARTNRVVSFDVNFSNDGNVDAVNAKLEILSNGSAPISFTIDGLKDNKTKLEIPLEEEEGIKGRLRPGGTGTVKVYSKASSALGFSIVLPE